MRSPRAQIADPHSSGLRGMLASFEIATFRSVWAGALSGNSGRFALILVAGWEAFQLGHHSSLWPSLVSMLLLVPSMFIGLFAGTIADRRNRARTAAAGQLINAASCGTAALLTLAGKLGLPDLLLLTAVVGIGNSIQGPAWQAMIPIIVGRERLLNASMTARIAQQGAELSGPAVGTAVLTEAGPAAAFFACSCFYLLGFFMFWRIRGAVPTPTRLQNPPGALQAISQGLSYVRSKASLLTLLLWVGLHCSLTMASVGILPAVATENLRGEAGAYGLLLTGFGFGSVCGPLFVMWLGNRASTVSMLVLSGILSGLPLISLGLVPVMGVDLISAAVAGSAQAVFMGAIYMANQGLSVDGMRGRVASVQLSLTTGAMGLASIGWGALAAVFAPGVVLAVPGAVFVLACIPFALHTTGLRIAVDGGQPAAPASSHPGPLVEGAIMGFQSPARDKIGPGGPEG